MVQVLHSRNHDPRPMKQINFFVPLNDNQGSPISQGNLQHLEDCIVLQFGAYTRHTRLHGCWTNSEGLRYQDNITIIEVITNDCPGLLGQVQAIGHVVLERFAQHEVFITIRDIETIHSSH